ncbi:TIGR03619 family F420-dependent LLM class oxidoreductase [Myxococcota bacterium]|nr:TIGR03619 family F420-dependent LLM class oxidoreductase [Myxococcota bacterium]
MKFAFSETMCDPSHLVPLAIEADQAGYDTFGIPDSICYPEVAVDEYPYNDDGSREFLDGTPFIDPFVLAASMAAVTERIVFETGVVKLPIRNPVLVAKTVSSVAVMSNNRFVFGVGLSPWVEDFQVCGQDWKTRGKRMGEMIEIIRGLMSGDYFSFKSEFYDIPRIKLCPVPTQPVKILYGGHTNAAYRRAARLADGFYFTGASEVEVLERMKIIDGYRREYGRENEPFEIHAGLAFSSLDDIKRLEDLGISQLVFGPRGGYEPDTLTFEQKRDILRKFADDVLTKL